MKLTMELSDVQEDVLVAESLRNQIKIQEESGITGLEDIQVIESLKNVYEFYTGEPYA